MKVVIGYKFKNKEGRWYMGYGDGNTQHKQFAYIYQIHEIKKNFEDVVGLWGCKDIGTWVAVWGEVT